MQAAGSTRRRRECRQGPCGLGRAPTAEELTAWNTNYNPTGKNLPPGQGTVAEGKVVYAAKCASCHGDAGQGMPPAYPQLVGKDPADFSFDNDFKIPHTIGNYWPYATTLYDYINRAMPLTAPGSLTAAGDLCGGGVPAGGERGDRGQRDHECDDAAAGEDAGAGAFRGG